AAAIDSVSRAIDEPIALEPCEPAKNGGGGNARVEADTRNLNAGPFAFADIEIEQDVPARLAQQVAAIEGGIAAAAHRIECARLDQTRTRTLRTFPNRTVDSPIHAKRPFAPRGKPNAQLAPIALKTSLNTACNPHLRLGTLTTPEAPLFASASIWSATRPVECFIPGFYKRC
ncbi:MAG TPA: hypothetical protein DDY37_04650, partial [Legionella sp.]|nr:hypothetical protein [Legionella sp.]